MLSVERVAPGARRVIGKIAYGKEEFGERRFRRFVNGLIFLLWARAVSATAASFISQALDRLEAQSPAHWPEYCQCRGHRKGSNGCGKAGRIGWTQARH